MRFAGHEGCPPRSSRRQHECDQQQPGAKRAECQYVSEPPPAGEQSYRVGRQEQPGDGGGQQPSADERGAVADVV